MVLLYTIYVAPYGTVQANVKAILPFETYGLPQLPAKTASRPRLNPYQEKGALTVASPKPGNSNPYRHAHTKQPHRDGTVRHRQTVAAQSGHDTGV